MMPVELNVRLFDQLDRLLDDYELVTPRAVVDELKALSGGHGTEATAASVGVDLTDCCTVVETDADYADDAVAELAADAAYVVTNDGPLRERLLSRGVPVIGLRGRSQLEVTEP